MKSKKESFKVRLGLFVVGGLVLFMLAIFVIGRQRQMFDPVFKLSSVFYNVSGLQVGNIVRFSGINVGTVDNIRIISDSTVLVEMLIKQSIQKFIKTDAEVGIGSEGIIGDRILNISQGSTEAAMVVKGQQLSSTEPIETDAIIASLEVTAYNAEVISTDLANIIFNINSGKGVLGKLIQDSSIAQTFGKTMDNLESSSKGLEENMEAAKGNVLLRGYYKRKRKAELKEININSDSEKSTR